MANEQGKKPVVHTKKHIARLERERRQSRLILYIFIGILATVIGLLVYGYSDLNYFQLRRPRRNGGREKYSCWRVRIPCASPASAVRSINTTRCSITRWSACMSHLKYSRSKHR